MKNVAIAVLLLLCSMLTFVFVDALYGVGRYDGGIKFLILQLAYGSIALSICSLFLLGRRTIALAVVTVAFVLFLPLFVHECLPGLIGLADPAYGSAYGSGRTVPFVRFDPVGFVSLGLYVAALVALFAGQRPRAG